MNELTNHGTSINGIPLNYSKEYASDEHKNINESKSIMISKKKRSDSKSCIMSDSIYMAF